MALLAVYYFPQAPGLPPIYIPELIAVNGKKCLGKIKVLRFVFADHHIHVAFPERGVWGCVGGLRGGSGRDGLWGGSGLLNQTVDSSEASKKGVPPGKFFQGVNIFCGGKRLGIFRGAPSPGLRPPPPPAQAWAKVWPPGPMMQGPPHAAGRVLWTPGPPLACIPVSTPR